jgi:hypothetical protein
MEYECKVEEVDFDLKVSDDLIEKDDITYRNDMPVYLYVNNKKIIEIKSGDIISVDTQPEE